MKKEKKKYKIYFIFSYSGTILSRIIKLYTKEEFCHISIALDPRLEDMYSFGRLNPYNPFIGGFIHEKVNQGTYKRFKNTKAAIYSLDVTYFQYRKLKRIIKKMNKNKHQYHFNLLGLIAIIFGIRLNRKNFYYCAEFVRYLIEEAGIDKNLPKLIKPMDFKNINDLELIYYGILKKYQSI